MDLPSGPGPRAISLLIARAVGGRAALVAFGEDGRPLRAFDAPEGAPYLAAGFALSRPVRFDLAEGRRTELEAGGQRFLALGAGDDDGTLWVALRPADEHITLPRFAQFMVHAVRNSLSSIKLAAQTLARADALGPRERKRATIAVREIGRLERLITTASEYARAPTRSGEPLDLAALLQGAVEATRSELEARNVRLSLELEPGLPRPVGDLLRLQLAFENLLAFAARAMPDGGEVVARLGVEDGRAVLSVRDHGPDLPDADAEALFLPFTQGSRAAGLDLALVAQVARELGGAYRAENAAPGARVQVWLGRKEGV